MRIIGNDPSVPRQTQEVASGTLPNGKPVVVNADGTVSVVAETSISQSAGAPVNFESGNTVYTSTAYDTNAQKVVIAYRDNGNSNYGTAIVGTVNGTSISFGSPVVFETAESSFNTIAYDANAQKVFIAFRDGGNGDYATAIVGTVSGTSISFGTPVVIRSLSSSELESTYDSNAQKVVVVSSVGSSQPQAFVGTISGTSVTFGSRTDFGGTNDITSGIAYDANAGKVVVAYRDGSNTYSNAVVGTVSGTSISFGTEVVFSGAGTEEEIGIAYDSNNQKIVIAFCQSDVGKGIVGTVSGTSISFGTAVDFNTANTRYLRAVYDTNAQKVVFFFRDADPFYGKAVSGTVSGTSITFSSITTFQEGRTQQISAAYDTNAQKVVVAYQDYAASNGDASVFTTGYTSQNITSENYIGISRSGAASGAGAIIDTQGAISDNQTGLTPAQSYFVQTDGTLGTTAADPSVFAGTAVSATKLIVKG